METALVQVLGMNWFTCLFCRTPKGLQIGDRVHAWHFTEYGHTEVFGHIESEDERSFIVIHFKTGRHYRVWRHDTRKVNEPLPFYPREDT